MDTSIPGLSVVPDFLSPSEQSNLLSIIDDQPWLSELKRRVQHYGYRYDYKKRAVDPAMYLGALPDWVQPLAQRLHDDEHIAVVPDQLILNEYVPGQGISAHVDCVPCFGDTILSITLGSPCVMDFTSLKGKRHVPVLLEAGSLVVMKGESRYQWKHAIAPRLRDLYDGTEIVRGRRVSLTFRKVI
jgi:alkylated DNA repair dioxygenase AlkB